MLISLSLTDRSRSWGVVVQDVAKTRAQLADSGQKHRILTTLRGLAADGGAKALFAGVGPRAARAAPACAIVLASYELLKASSLAS